MFSERLENLIKAALQDGVLTDQEKNAIAKRAEAEGEDIDEVDIYIQSLMQKRQQELNLKNAKENAIQYEAITQEEKERSKTLRKCPKCGSYIPHLSNICPNCGFVIAQNETDKRISSLLSLLRMCIDDIYFSDWSGASFQLLSNWSVNIKKEVYDLLPNCYILIKESELGQKYVKVEYNIAGIIAESQMYSDNDSVKTLLDELHIKEKNLLVKGIKTVLQNFKPFMSAKNKEYYIGRLNICINKLKNYSDVIDVVELKYYEDIAARYNMNKDKGLFSWLACLWSK